jgi:hypothetical protein
MTSTETTKTHHLPIAYRGETIGETANNLAEALSGEADIQGLYIIEEALRKAKEIRSRKQRSDEAAAIFARHGIKN